MPTSIRTITLDSYTAGKITPVGGSDDWIGKNHLIKLSSGVFVAMTREGTGHSDPTGHPPDLRFSEDEGATWTARNTFTDGGPVTGLPTSAVQAGADILECIIIESPGGSLWLLSNEGERGGSNRYGMQAYKSTDGGKTFSSEGKIAFDDHTDNGCKLWDYVVVDGVTYFTVMFDTGADMSSPYQTLLYKCTASDDYTSMTHVADITSTSDDTHEAAIWYLPVEEEFSVVLRTTGDGNGSGCMISKSTSVSEIGDTWPSPTFYGDQLGEVKTPKGYTDSSGRHWLCYRKGDHESGVSSSEQNAIAYTLDGVSFSQPFIPHGGNDFADDTGYCTIVETSTTNKFYGQAYYGTDDAAEIDDFEFTVVPGRRDVAVRTVRLNTTDTTVEIKTPGFGTPTGALLFMTPCTDMDSRHDGGGLMVGMTDFTNHGVVYFRCDHGETVPANNDTVRGQNDSNCVEFAETAGAQTVSVEATASAVTDGIRLTFTDLPSSSMYLGAVLFGPQCKCSQVTQAMSTQDTDVTVSTTGVDPDIVFAAMNGGTSNGVSTHAIFSFGAYDGTNQFGVAFNQIEEQDPTNGESWHWDDRSGGQYHNGTEAWSLLLSSLGSEQFTATAKDGNSNSDRVMFLAVDMPHGVSVQNVDLPTSAGDQTYGSHGFTESPEFAMLVTGFCQNYNSAESEARLHLSVTDGAGEFTASNVADSGLDSGSADTTVAHSRMHDGSFDWGTVNNANLYQGRFKDFDNDDVTYDFDATSGATRKAGLIAFETDTPDINTPDEIELTRFDNRATNNLEHRHGGTGNVVLKGGVPFAYQAPQISGDPEPGSELRTSVGVFGGTTPISYEYQWYRESNAPEAIAPPVITDTEGTGGAFGDELSCDNGAFGGSQPITYTYQWYRETI